jgi:allantoin racemase
MAPISLAIIRVMTLSESMNEAFSARLEEQFPFLKIHSFAIEDQPEGVHDPQSFSKAEPKIVRLIQTLSTKDYHGFFVNCAEDPGIQRARDLTSVPVWGAGSSAACVTKSTGLPVGVIGLTEQIPPVISEILGGQIIASSVPRGVVTASDLATASDSISEAAKFCTDKGARCILLACTGMSLLGTANSIRTTLNIPVIDPLFAPLAVIQQIYYKTPDFR